MTIERGGGRPDKYVLKDGTRVIGTTTCIGRFTDKGPLMQWAFVQGQSGAKSLYEKRDEAGDVGGYAHDWIQAEIHSDPIIIKVPDEMLERVTSAFNSYKEWFAGARMTIIATEVPLVSEQYRFGGTIDAVARDKDGRVCLLDWKSSSGIYSDYALQLAAYKQLWDENRPDLQITGGFHICRFSKEYADFEHRHFGELNVAWKMFSHLLIAYECDKELRKRIK